LGTGELIEDVVSVKNADTRREVPVDVVKVLISIATDSTENDAKCVASIQ